MAVPPRDGKRSYGSACTLCKSKAFYKTGQANRAADNLKGARKKCTWPEETTASGEGQCVLCSNKGLQCPGLPSPPPKRRRLPSQTPSDASGWSTSTTIVSLSSRSASSRASSVEVANLLATQLLRLYNTHWLVTPIGLDMEKVFRDAGGRVDHLDLPSKALYLSALALAARSSSHPAIAGNSSPTLEFVDSTQADGIDFSEYGVIRRGPCSELTRQATSCCFADPMVATSSLALQVSLLGVYMLTASTMEGEASQDSIRPAISVFRQTQYPLEPGERKIWEDIGKSLLLVEALVACNARALPLFSDREAEMLSPRSKRFQQAHGTLDLDMLDFVQNCEEDFPYEKYMTPVFRQNTDDRMWLFRTIARLLQTPFDLVHSVAGQLDSVWSIFNFGLSNARAAHQLAEIIRTEVVAADLGDSSSRRANFLVAAIPAMVGRSALTQFTIHSVIKSWFAEGSLKDPSVLEKSIVQTRRSLKYLAATFHDYRWMPLAASVFIGQTFLRVETAPDWVEIALERLPGHQRMEEVTMQELEWLVEGMRKAGWSYGRATIRLRELEAGVLDLKQAIFDESEHLLIALKRKNN
ncbi:hypothetical protein P7C70_g2043, partial [Phenoliferia sp. Uapishka_3]